MMQICDRIYLKDLCITDIISPGMYFTNVEKSYLKVSYFTFIDY